MKRPNFNEKTEIKVIEHDYYGDFDKYGLRGTVVDIVGIDADGNDVMKPYSPENYPDRWLVKVKIFIDGHYEVANFWNWPKQLEPVQKKFIDIDYIRENDLVIGKKEDGTDAVRPKNTGAFEPGDIIQISTKIDGANASIAWDETTGKLEIFSRTNLLDSPGALRGFYDYIKTEVEPEFLKRMNSDFPSLKEYVIFGEWCVGHSIKSYNKDWFNKWRVYDIWDKTNQRYLLQNIVESICQDFGFEYIEELYYGPFISWEHCRSFLSKSTAYGPEQEGIVIKNQSKLGDESCRAPTYLKIVNERFKESQCSKKEKKPIDPAVEAAKAEAAKLATSIVTEARVRKLILKMVDEGKLPTELQPKDMCAVMKLLPKMCFDDCLKEEKIIVQQLGSMAGKCIAAETAKQARKIVIGG